MPKLLTTEQVGLTRVLVTYSSLLAIVASLGFMSSIYRLFPYFRNPENKHNGIFFLTCMVNLVGFILTVAGVILFKEYIINDPDNLKVDLFKDYYYYIIPLIFFSMLYSMADIFFVVLYNSVIGTFVKEFLQRIFILISIGLYFFKIMDLNGFIIAYICANSLPSIIIITKLLIERHFDFKPDFKLLKKSMVATMVSMSVFGLLVSLSNLVIQYIDSVMLHTMLGLEATGIYTIWYFFGQVIVMPSRSVKKITSTIISEAWKSNDFELIKKVYYKSSLNQVIFGLFLFILVTSNIHNILRILPPEYAVGKYVVYFVGLSSLFEMLAGVSSVIVSNSKYYKNVAYFIGLFIVFVILGNFIFIPLMGLLGTAVAACIAAFLYCLIRIFFVYYKLRIFPFDRKYIWILLISVSSFLISSLLPVLGNVWLDLFIRCVVISLLFCLPIYFFKISEDINKLINQLYQRFFVKPK